MLHKLEVVSRLLFPIVIVLTAIGAAMLYFGASENAMSRFVLIYFVVAAPLISVALARPFVMWRGSKPPPRDLPDEWR